MKHYGAPGHNFPNQEEVERVREVLTRQGKALGQIAHESGIPRDMAFKALNVLGYRQISVRRGANPVRWSLRRSAHE